MQVKPENHMLACPNKKLFGVDCPGCGFQRSVIMVSKGEFSNAFQMFPAVYSTLALLLVVGLHFLLKKKITLKLILIIAILNVLILIITYIAKMKNLFLN
ncbi:DUF2752 domain-containing protein [Tenacibaculum agarivorans]|uniref:DUF2752 domain-containing protein n=1 Tax=Tenacibaculum agarivorans TaxID=1908389 RepID=UPI00094B7C5B|nr:DUF2752 domain-containing protein [Tenacibaculum agarivorans]